MRSLVLILMLCWAAACAGQSHKTIALLREYSPYSPMGVPFNNWLDSFLNNQDIVVDTVQLNDTTAYRMLKAHMRNPALSRFPAADSVVMYLVRIKLRARKTVNGFETANVEIPMLSFSMQYYFPRKAFWPSAWEQFWEEHRKYLRRRLFEMFSHTTTKRGNCCYEEFSYAERINDFPLVRTLYRYDEEKSRYVFSFDINFLLKER